MRHARRARRRARGERGATLFVVVLAITMLTGVGLFTVHSSALLARAAGNEREAMQTTYLAELGTLAALTVVGSAPLAYMNLADQGLEDCWSTRGIDTSVYGVQHCIELSDNKMIPQTGALLFGADSFGTVKDSHSNAFAITGRVSTELHDVYKTAAFVPGYPDGSFIFKNAKITTTATLQPVEAGTMCVENVMQAAGQHVTRAHVRVGPIPK